MRHLNDLFPEPTPDMIIPVPPSNDERLFEQIQAIIDLCRLNNLSYAATREKVFQILKPRHQP